MLSAIRLLVRNPIFGGFILVLLVLAFALFGVENIFRGGGNAAVLVGSEQVTVRDVQRAYDAQLQAIQRENSRFTREQAEQFGIPDRVVEQLTVQAAVNAKSRELGLSLSDARLAESIRAVSAFENPFTGEFDRSTYLSVLNQNGYQGAIGEELFEEAIAEEMTRNQYVGATLGGTRAPEIFALAARAYDEERRTIDAILISPSLAGDIPTPTDDDLSAYISGNPSLFQQPEQRRFTLVRISPALIQNDIDVNEDDLSELYEFRLEQGELTVPATRSLRQWPADDQASAEQAANRIAAGDPAETVATELGLGDPVALDDVQQFEIPDAAIADAAFAMGSGDVQAIEGRLGWRVVQITAADDPEVPSLEDVRSELITDLAGETALDAVYTAMGVLEGALEERATLENAARAAGIPAEQFDWISARGIMESGANAYTLGEAPEILETVFSLPGGFNSDRLQFGENGFFYVRVDEIRPARVPDLEEVRETAEAFWRLQRVDDQLQSVVDDAMARARAGESLTAIAASLDGARVETSTLGRNETAAPSFSRQLVGQAFNAELGTPFESRAGDGRTRTVALVSDIIAPQTGPVSPELLIGLTESLEADLSLALQNAVLDSYEIRRDQRLIDLGLGRIDPLTLQ